MIYQHFRKYEHPFVDRVLEWIHSVSTTYTPYVTDFLDPREQQIITTIIGKNNEEINYALFGGFQEAERKRAIIAPFYEHPIEEDFEVCAVEASFNEKFIQIGHRDVLGAFTSLGVDRRKLGDVIVSAGKVQLITSTEMAQYIRLHLTQIRQASVKFTHIALDALEKSQDNWQKKTYYVSSLRVDAVVKEMYHLPRNRATKLIEAEHVRLNFMFIDDPTIQLIEGDLISVRGYGRSKFISIEGKTRKDRLRIIAAHLKG